jgi:hypothetical protein
MPFQPQFVPIFSFMQFGHNDMKANRPQTYVEPFTTHKH